MFCFVWSIGASLDESVWDNFDDLVRETFADLVKLPPNGDVHDFYVKLPENALTHWKEMVRELGLLFRGRARVRTSTKPP